MRESQRILKPKDKIVIVTDYREKEIIKYLKDFGVRVNEMNLMVGDFICSGGVAIERKTHSDFISSIIDGRIFEQAKTLKEGFEKPIIIIEGYSTREINGNALKGAIASLLVDWGISLLTTKNSLDTAKTIYWIAKKEQTKSRGGISVRVGKKPKEIKRLQEKIISGLPGVSTIISKRLLDYFGSVENVFKAREGELKKVKGMGKKLVKKIRKILTEKY
jgi:Fanconi anemia group M protein